MVVLLAVLHQLSEEQLLQVRPFHFIEYLSLCSFLLMYTVLSIHA